MNNSARVPVILQTFYYKVRSFKVIIGTIWFMQVPPFAFIFKHVRVRFFANFSVKVLPYYRIHTTLILTLLPRIHPLLQSFKVNITHGSSSISRAHFRVIVSLIARPSEFSCVLIFGFILKSYNIIKFFVFSFYTHMMFRVEFSHSE